MNDEVRTDRLHFIVHRSYFIVSLHRSPLAIDTGAASRIASSHPRSNNSSGDTRENELKEAGA
jgi:hypothetical protein